MVYIALLKNIFSDLFSISHGQITDLRHRIWVLFKNFRNNVIICVKLFSKVSDIKANILRMLSERFTTIKATLYTCSRFCNLKALFSLNNGPLLNLSVNRGSQCLYYVDGFLFFAFVFLSKILFFSAAKVNFSTA